ncbi:hypothetical protein [Peribacillus asahii]|uniref:hypothetical protein n=1 Tax=Peribacillus asahii TaxID=228899 RepID=UPI00207ABFEA|nr:hypothetical protein [Peribacillus asahii]USK62273.1 hypothetical protein LIT37_24165 [Peribacillus asahii]
MDSGIKLSHYGEERDINLNEEETQAVKLIFEMLEDTVIDIDKLKVTRKSDNYATIVLRGNDWDFDFVRFKFTNRTKWIALNLSKADRAAYKDDTLFEAQKKKTQIQWKSVLQSIEDLPKYKNLMVNSYSECINREKNNFQ